MRTVAIHQPEFMPWMGFFHKMRTCEVYIVLDHVQFKKRYFENRNRIVSRAGETLWIGVPVRSKGRYTQQLADVEIDEDGRWQHKLLERVRHAYGRSAFFEQYYDDLAQTVIGKNYGGLVELNVSLIEFFRRHLGIDTPMVYSSSLDAQGYKGSRLILELCMRAGAKRYLCGASGKDYLVEEDFAQAGIEIDYLNYSPPVYPQLCPEHVSHLSSIDLLFNSGPEAGDILTRTSSKKGGQP